MDKELTENQINAKALIIGRELERINWYDVMGTESWTWCINKAKESGAILLTDRDKIAYLAMMYVANNH